jgi:hypothetical protein
LKNAVSKLDRIVFGDDAFVLNRENPIQIQMSHRHKSRARLSRWNREFLIKLRDVIAVQKVVGFFQGLDVADPQFLRQSSLPGAKVALASPARLRRIGGDGFNAQFLESSTDFGFLARIDRLSGLGCAEKMACSIAIEG